MSEKRYLGDSVYVEMDELHRVVLTTNNGYADDPRNRIVLEGAVYVELLRYVRTEEDLTWRYHNDARFHAFVERMQAETIEAYKEHHHL